MLWSGGSRLEICSVACLCRPADRLPGKRQSRPLPAPWPYRSEALPTPRARIRRPGTQTLRAWTTPLHGRAASKRIYGWHSGPPSKWRHRKNRNRRAGTIPRQRPAPAIRHIRCSRRVMPRRNGTHRPWTVRLASTGGRGSQPLPAFPAYARHTHPQTLKTAVSTGDGPPYKQLWT